MPLFQRLVSLNQRLYCMYGLRYCSAFLKDPFYTEHNIRLQQQPALYLKTVLQLKASLSERPVWHALEILQVTEIDKL